MKRPSKANNKLNQATHNNPPPPTTHNNNISHNRLQQQSEAHRTQELPRAHPQSSWTQPSLVRTISCLSTRPSSISARLLLPSLRVLAVDITNCGPVTRWGSMQAHSCQFCASRLSAAVSAKRLYASSVKKSLTLPFLASTEKKPLYTRVGSLFCLFCLVSEFSLFLLHFLTN